ncbi:hypothetical protein D6C94_06597 [Aureobasidium pullulans]|uniref:Isochorismatase-like domain-containing protein n=1 Tax=Aureobasidium pullulans TaxID=5580 RepID=A0AB38LTD8_AURPU|nr:hypothetical protein D6C94_06597 [Aureobasidium pullulans]
MGTRTALFVVDVQEGIANATDGVPDAEQIKQAISSVINLARQHNDTLTGDEKSSEKLKIIFVQHDDKDPKDPLHRGKPTWNLVFQPRPGFDTEMLVSKNVRLAASLRDEGIANLVFVGLQTDYCVRGSILGAISSGFEASNIVLLQGAHSTYDDATTGKSYVQIKADVEKQLMNVGVRLQDWKEFIL